MDERRAITFKKLCDGCEQHDYPLGDNERERCFHDDNPSGGIDAEHCPRWAELPPASAIPEGGDDECPKCKDYMGRCPGCGSVRPGIEEVPR